MITNFKIFESNLNDEFIYHGTNKGAALNIQKDGYMKPHNTGEELASISFTSDINYAEYYAKYKGGKDKMVILRTKLSDKFKPSPKYDNNDGYEYITFNKIYTDELEIRTPNKTWISLDKWNVIFDEPK